jgi:UDP-N-acetylmuramoyl-tripeptide--D-alanyl-D-alanine ligase
LQENNIKYKPKIIGVTGSFGKSSAKEAVFHVLSYGERKVRRNRGNFNNELGFPLAVIGDFDHLGGVFFYLGAALKGFRVWLGKSDYPKILILEYGADKPGDIKYLTEIARPDVAIVTGISDIPVHVEFYPSSEAVAEEKFNLVKALNENGTAILNADDALVAKMAEKTSAGTLFS